MAKQQDPFYDALASDYDQMTRFQERFENQKRILKAWIDRLKCRAAVDIACGTGLHVLCLQEMGIRTIGIDYSVQMLKQATLSAREMGHLPCFVRGDMRMLPFPDRSFDLALNLGNSLPHLQSTDELQRALEEAKRILREGGHLLLQQLNYKRILKEQKRILSIRRTDQMEFVRFYDFLPGNQLRFNILEIDASANPIKHRLLSTKLRPHLLEEIINALKRSGLEIRGIYGNLQGDPFDETASPDVILWAQKT